MPFIQYSIDVKGTEQMLAIFKAVGEATFMQGVSRAVVTEANKIMRASKAQVPLRDGPLRASATVNPISVSGSRWEITMGYGGAASAYALIQHENMGFHHSNGRKPHYLSDPVRDAMPSMQARLARVVAAYFTPYDAAGGAAARAAGVAAANAAAAKAAAEPTTVGEDYSGDE